MFFPVIVHDDAAMETEHWKALLSLFDKEWSDTSVSHKCGFSDGGFRLCKVVIALGALLGDISTPGSHICSTPPPLLQSLGAAAFKMCKTAMTPLLWKTLLKLQLKALRFRLSSPRPGKIFVILIRLTAGCEISPQPLWFASSKPTWSPVSFFFSALWQRTLDRPSCDTPWQVSGVLGVTEETNSRPHSHQHLGRTCKQHAERNPRPQSNCVSLRWRGAKHLNSVSPRYCPVYS